MKNLKILFLIIQIVCVFLIMAFGPLVRNIGLIVLYLTIALETYLNKDWRHPLLLGALVLVGLFILYYFIGFIFSLFYT